MLSLIGRKIRKTREAKGWTQTHLSDRMGLADYRLISQFENGHRDIRLSTLHRIAKALAVSPQELFPVEVPTTGIDEEMLLLVREIYLFGPLARSQARHVLKALILGRDKK